MADEVERLEEAFKSVRIVALSELIDGIAMLRADDEPRILGQKLLDAGEIGSQNKYDFDDLIHNLTPKGFQYLLPKMLRCFLNGDWEYDDNVATTLLYFIDLKQRRRSIDAHSEVKFLSEFRELLSHGQISALCVAFERFMYEAYFLDDRDRENITDFTTFLIFGDQEAAS